MTGNKPTLIAYSVKERGKGKTAIWTRIGAAWPFEPGKTGFTVQLEALPIGDRIVLAEPKAEAEGRARVSALFTTAQREQLLDNGRRQAAVKGTTGEIDFHPVIKLFNPVGAATWLLTEIDPDDETVAWGLCDLGMGFPEFGTVSLTELADHRGGFGLGIERDLHFEARGPISLYIAAANKAGCISEDISPSAS